MIKGIITKKEMKVIRDLDAIDINKDAIKIMENPESYFNPHFKNAQDASIAILAKFTVYTILKKLDASESIGEKTAKYFMKNYTFNEWIDKVKAFYSYIISIIDYLMDHHNNTMLDLYNEGHMDKEMLEKTITTFQNAKKEILKDKETILGWINDMDQERERQSGQSFSP